MYAAPINRGASQNSGILGGGGTSVLILHVGEGCCQKGHPALKKATMLLCASEKCMLTPFCWEHSKEVDFRKTYIFWLQTHLLV